jgi:hypothetical protein
MGRATIILLAGLAILTGTAGCSLCRHNERPCDHEEVPPALPEVARSNLEPDLLALAASVQPAEPPAGPRSTAAYRALAPQFCQCRAAQKAPTADSLDSQRRKLEERDQKGSCPCGHKSEKQRAFQEAMLLYTALEMRDQAAGTALQWYYQLAGDEARADLLNASLEKSRDTLQRAERLKEQGIRLPAPLEEYQRQTAALELQQAQNQLDIEQLNSKLRQALELDPGGRFWPDPSVPVGTEVIPDVEAAVQLGLAQRPQLLLLRAMIANLDKDTLESARALLLSINPLLAMASPKSGCKMLTILGKLLHIQPGQRMEVEKVRAQLKDHLRERERVVAEEVREAAYEVGARRELILLAHRVAGHWNERIKDLEKKQRQGMPVFADLTTAYMEWYKARGDVAKEFLGWKVAAVKVKQAQGILPAECGYTDCTK